MGLRRDLAHALHRAPRIYGWTRSVVSAIDDRRRPLLVEGVGRIHRSDLMYDPRGSGSAQHYADVGDQVARFLCDNADLTRAAVLDFGSGYGRVTRVLAARFPAARLSVCDLDARAVAFCAREFGATPIAGDPDVGRLDLGTYDVVWMGSVLTHVDRPTAVDLVRRLKASVVPGGLLAFSTHGAGAERGADQLASRGSVSPAGISDELDATGWAYRAYPHHRGYGLAWVRPAAVVELVGPEFTCVDHRDSAWGGSQDLWAFRRLPESDAGGTGAR